LSSNCSDDSAAPDLDDSAALVWDGSAALDLDADLEKQVCSVLGEPFAGAYYLEVFVVAAEAYSAEVCFAEVCSAEV
jgi:hypothetical protein